MLDGVSLGSKLTIKINDCLTTVIVDSHHYLFTEDSHFYNEGQTGDNLVSLVLSRDDLTLIKSFTLKLMTAMYLGIVSSPQYQTSKYITLT